MDNYQVSINGNILAARIPGIETLDVQFFYNQDLTRKGINAIFLKDEYIIAFNEEWIEQANQLEIQVTCFHETGHAFQWKCIKGECLKGKELDTDMLEIRKNEINNYNQPTTKDVPEEFNLKQKIEIDAIAFAHYQMNKIFEVKTVIPKIIISEVKMHLTKFQSCI
jgi:hypothetical protein